MLFYVVSGFLISYALANKYPPGRSGVIAYLKSRFIRIYPLYWFMFAVAVFVIDGAFYPNFTSIALGLILVGGDWIPFLAKNPNGWQIYPPYMGLAWTLGVEVTFYLLAPLLLRSVLVSSIAFLLAILLGGFKSEVQRRVVSSVAVS
jgi:peptidoglycan/LPS O-acetylase OafA/YrhL